MEQLKRRGFLGRGLALLALISIAPHRVFAASAPRKYRFVGGPLHGLECDDLTKELGATSTYREVSLEALNENVFLAEHSYFAFRSDNPSRRGMCSLIWTTRGKLRKYPINLEPWDWSRENQ